MGKFVFLLFFIVISFKANAYDTLAHKQVRKYLNDFEYYQFLEEHRQNASLIEKLHQQSIQLKHEIGIIKFGNILGVIARDKAQFDRATQLHQNSLSLAIRRKDTLEQVISLNNLGVVSRRLFRPVRATNYHLEALRLLEKLDSKNAIVQKSKAIGFNSVGNINLMQKNYKKAIEFFKRALHVEGMELSTLGRAINVNNIGAAYEELNQLDSALIFYRKSLSLNHQINSNKGIAICNNGIGSIYMQRNMADSALVCFNIAKECLLQRDDKYNLISTHLNIGHAYLMMKHYKHSQKYLDSAIATAQSFKARGLYERGLRLLSKLNRDLQHFDLALAYYQQADNIKDSLINERNSQYLNDLQTLYDSERKQLEITRLSKQNLAQEQHYQRRHFMMVVVLIMLLAVVITTLALSYMWKLKDKHEQIKLRQIILRSQMNPHFIFNMLLTIQNSIYQENKLKAYNLLGKFSKMTRSVLNFSEQDFISLSNEIQLLKTYVELQKSRFPFEFEFICSEQINMDHAMIPPMLIQPFIENAINHGVRPVDYLGHICLELKKQNGMLQVIVTDNGIGIKNSKSKSKFNHSSKALKIFMARTEILGRIYKKNVNFEIVDLSEENEKLTGTSVRFCVPLNWDK